MQPSEVGAVGGVNFLTGHRTGMLGGERRDQLGNGWFVGIGVIEDCIRGAAVPLQLDGDRPDEADQSPGNRAVQRPEWVSQCRRRRGEDDHPAAMACVGDGRPVMLNGGKAAISGCATARSRSAVSIVWSLSVPR